MFERNFKNNKKLFGKNMKIKRSFSFCQSFEIQKEKKNIRKNRNFKSHYLIHNFLKQLEQ